MFWRDQPFLKNTVRCVSKNDNDVAHHKCNAHQPIFVIFGRDAAERVCCRTVWFFET